MAVYIPIILNSSFSKNLTFKHYTHKRNKYSIQPVVQQCFEQMSSFLPFLCSIPEHSPQTTAKTHVGALQCPLLLLQQTSPSVNKHI